MSHADAQALIAEINHGWLCIVLAIVAHLVYSLFGMALGSLK